MGDRHSDDAGESKAVCRHAFDPSSVGAIRALTCILLRLPRREEDGPLELGGGLARLAARGGTPDKTPFRDAVKPVWDKYGSKFTDLIKQIQAVS